MNVVMALRQQLRTAYAGWLPIAALLLTAAPAIQAQQTADDLWTCFQDPKTKKYGYRDSRGVVRVKPRFDDAITMPAQRRRYITAVSEKYHYAYLLKSGRLVARDSVFVSDFSFDCEREGYIRFQDQKKDRVGYLNQRGKPVIPAMYNFALPFHNGLAMARKGARRRMCAGLPDADTLHCEHLDWQGGTWVLINPRNEVLVPNLVMDDLMTLNWYSLKINPAADDTLYRVRLVGTGGTVYSFVDYRREFRQWFYHDFLPAVYSPDTAQLAALCFTDLRLARRPFDGWHPYRRAAFVQAHGPLLAEHLRTLNQQEVGFGDELPNTMIHNEPSFAVFQTLCGEHDREKYPVMGMTVWYGTHTPSRADDHYEHFSFVRTAEGYRLIRVAL